MESRSARQEPRHMRSPRLSISRSLVKQVVAVKETLTPPILAPSPRVLEWLLQRGRIPSRHMALTVIDPPSASMPESDIPTPPPATVVTPCDPWPRPYYLHDGLRRVKPYHFTYNTWCKQRWRGREILDIFRDEFRDRTSEYYVGTAPPRPDGDDLTDTARGTPSRRAPSTSTASPYPRPRPR